MKADALIAGLLTQKTDNILVQLFRYFFVGGIAFLVHFGVFSAFIYFDP